MIELIREKLRLGKPFIVVEKGEERLMTAKFYKQIAFTLGLERLMDDDRVYCTWLGDDGLPYNDDFPIENLEIVDEK